jgi:uncharacterized membrane protein YfcA
MDPTLIWLPIAQREFSAALLLLLGLCVGILGGFFGVGGAWIVTPALNIFGFDMSFAIGTDLAHIFGKSIIATKKHSRMGNVDYRLGFLSLVGSVVGVEAGAQSIMALERGGSVGPVVRWVYMVLLFGLGIYMLYDYIRATKRPAAVVTTGAPAAPSTLSQRVHALKIPPMISLPTSGIDQVSVFVVIFIFALTGFLSGFLGVGGGFILLPSLIYLIGCPTAVAVGTSLLCVLFMGGYGCFSYAMKGRTELVAAVVMLGGAAVGAQIGVLATRFVRGYGIRLLFAVMILLAGLSVSLKQAERMFDLPALGSAAGVVVLLAAGGMSALIFYRLLRGAAAEKAEKKLSGLS